MLILLALLTSTLLWSEWTNPYVWIVVGLTVPPVLSSNSVAVASVAIELNPNDARYYRQRSLIYLFTDRMELAEADEEMCEELRNREGEWG